jgi:hypothetical protein
MRIPIRLVVEGCLAIMTAFVAVTLHFALLSMCKSNLQTASALSYRANESPSVRKNRRRY